MSAFSLASPLATHRQTAVFHAFTNCTLGVRAVSLLLTLKLPSHCFSQSSQEHIRACKLRSRIRALFWALCTPSLQTHQWESVSVRCPVQLISGIATAANVESHTHVLCLPRTCPLASDHLSSHTGSLLCQLVLLTCFPSLLSFLPLYCALGRPRLFSLLAGP